jgi:hypothetical protein
MFTYVYPYSSFHTRLLLLGSYYVGEGSLGNSMMPLTRWWTTRPLEGTISKLLIILESALPKSTWMMEKNNLSLRTVYPTKVECA